MCTGLIGGSWHSNPFSCLSPTAGEYIKRDDPVAAALSVMMKPGVKLRGRDRWVKLDELKVGYCVFRGNPRNTQFIERRDGSYGRNIMGKYR